MKTFRNKSRYPLGRPYFEPSEIDGICDNELRKAGLFPDSPSPIRIERFVEKRFGVTPEYEDLPEGILGYTCFGDKCVEAIVISALLGSATGKVAERRVRTTLAHEAGHGLLHGYLFAASEQPPNLFDADNQSNHKILCRDIQDDEERGHSYDGRWWEFQANRAMVSLVCPRSLFGQALSPFLVSSGSLGLMSLDPSRKEEAVRCLSIVFDLNPIVVRYRIDDLYPEQGVQLHL